MQALLSSLLLSVNKYILMQWQIHRSSWGANECVNAAGGTRLNKTADNGGHISVPAVPVGSGSRGPTWPVTCDTQYGSPRLIDATLSTLITETAATSKAAN